MIRGGSFFIFFFNDTATTEIYTLSLHDALPICELGRAIDNRQGAPEWSPDGNAVWCTAQERGSVRLYRLPTNVGRPEVDRKSTRLNSSHVRISYAVFCLRKKKQGATASLCAGDV